VAVDSGKFYGTVERRIWAGFGCPAGGNLTASGLSRLCHRGLGCSCFFDEGCIWTVSRCQLGSLCRYPSLCFGSNHRKVPRGEFNLFF
jgi:hypothetical protein